VQHFLVVGRVNEPNVLFDTGKIKFGPLLLGGKNKEVVALINQEHIPFSFSFAKESVKGSPDFGDSLRVSPMTGTVPAGSQVPVEVLFQPKYELNYNYNLICNVKRKERPLVLNVKGEGYKIHHSVFAGSNRVEMQAGEPHKFDFGDFFINEKKTKKVVVTNSGEFNFDFVWKRQVNKYIQITPETGSVPKGEEVEFEITYLPIGEHQLKNYRLQLHIISGPKYDFHLVGRARKPGIKLSATVIDFGPCFVSRQPVAIKKLLTVSNVDSSAISVETDWVKKPHLDVLLTPGQVLMPEGSDDVEKLQIPILFTPRDIKAYHEKFTLDFNNLYKVDVVVKGEGIPLQLELVDQDQAFLDFGIISVGGDITKTVPLINRSKRPVTFKLKPSDAAHF
jgi:hydrocephalus-inducing protein